MGNPTQYERGKSRISTGEKPKFQQYLREMVKKSPSQKLCFYRSMIKNELNIEYSTDSAISKLFKDAEIYRIENENYDPADGNSRKRIWVYIPNNFNSLEENPLHKKIKGLVKSKPFPYFGKQFILTIPTQSENIEKLCKRLHSYYIDKKGVTIIPAYLAICVICNNQRTFELIYNDVNSFFDDK